MAPGESPSAETFREALATVRRDALPTFSTKRIFGRMFGRSKQDAGKEALNGQEEVDAGKEALNGQEEVDAGKEALNGQEEVDAAQPPSDVANIHEPFVVSPTSAKEIMLDLPDRSAENAASIVNDLALNDVTKSSPKPAVLGKRKRQEAAVVDEYPKERVTKGSGTNGTRAKSHSMSTDGITGHGGSSHRASSEVVNVASGKLPRPKKKQQKRHMAEIYPAVQTSGDIWDPAPSPKKQVEKIAPHPTTTKRTPSSPEVTPRPRGRPPRVGLSPTTKTKSLKKGQRRETQDTEIKPWRKGRPEGYLTPEVESQEDHEIPIKSLPQKAGPKAGPKASRTKFRDDHKQRSPNSKATRSTAAANGQKDIILNAVTDLTKKPERDARRAAKQRKGLEPASVSIHPRARVDSLVEGKSREIALRARNREKAARARAQRADDESQEDVVGDFEVSPRLQNEVSSKEHEGAEEEEEEERETGGRRGPEEAIDRDGRTSVQMDEGEEEDAEAEEEDSDFEDPTQIIESDEEEDEGEEKLELFGEDGAWKTVLEGVHSVCGSKLPLNRMPKLLTDTVNSLVNDVREARELYEQLLPFKGIDHDSLDGLNDQLGERLDAIENQIKRFSEKNAGTKGSEIIRDIYARAIPAMVFLLQSALASRVYHSDEPCDLETLNGTVRGLKEIVRLQSMTILLCMKAKSWKAKPVPTRRPIIKPTTQKIYPYVKVIREAFAKKLSAQERTRKVKQNKVDTQNRQSELVQLSQQAQQEATRKNEILLRKIRESREQEEERRRNAKRTFQQFKEDEPRAEREITHVESSTLWSDAEDLELYFQLEKGYVGGLTTMERYANILNTRLLQNKLPEHIRERALYFKPTLLEERGALEWISSIE